MKPTNSRRGGALNTIAPGVGGGSNNFEAGYAYIRTEREKREPSSRLDLGDRPADRPMANDLPWDLRGEAKDVKPNREELLKPMRYRP